MSRSDAGDAELVARMIDGDQAALGELYDRYAGAAYATAQRLLGDPASAEEVVQETMLALWNRAELYDPRVASLGAWLATIARNRAIDRLRARRRRLPAMPLSSIVGRKRDDDDARAGDRVLDRGLLVAAAERELEPSAAGEAAWLRMTLLSAIATLPAPERQVIELAYAADLTQSEIAAHLGWPLGTVKTRTRRALAWLRTAVSEPLGPDRGLRPVEDAATSASTASGPGRQPAATGEKVASAGACA
jgi:RNA polymerase sigma-70 factor (ECF subfamily)